MTAQQDFLEACHDGNLERVNTLISRYDISGSSWLARMGLVALGQDTINVAHDNNMALRLAATNDHPAIVNRLLDIPAVRDNAAADNNLALRLAAQRGHLAILNRLLDIPAVRDNAAAGNNMVFQFSAARGHLDIVDRLLDIPAVQNNAAADNNLVLRWAAENGHLDIVDRLLDIPAVQDNAAANDNKALVGAARYGHLAIVNRLLAIPAVQDNAVADDNMALRWAAENGHLDIVDRLLDISSVRDNASANDNEALQWAALNNHPAIVNRLLDIPAVLNNAAANNNHALRWAARNGHLAIVNRLLDIPAVLNNAAADNNMMFQWAAQMGFHLAIVNRLLDIPAVRDNATADNNRALRMAAQHGHLPVVTRLLEIPAVVNAIHHRRGDFLGGNTAIVEAFENGHHDVVAALQARGAILPAYLRVPADARPERPAIARPGRAAAVINGGQSVHVVSVHVSVSGSAKNLMDFYPDINNPKNVQEQIAGLQTWLNTEQAKARLAEDPISKQINAAIACVKRLSNLNFTDQRSNVSMRQALALVWVGINNIKANGAGAALLTEGEIKNRRESFITCLYEIQRGYNFSDNDSATPVDLGGADIETCSSGSFNKLIAGLAQVGHKGVSLIFVTAATLLLKAQSLPKKIFLDLPPEKRAYYAKNWEAAPALSAAEESPSDGIQTEFFEECKPLMRDLLKTEFDEFKKSIASRYVTYEEVMESTIESVIDDAAQVMSTVIQEEKSRLAAAVAAVAAVAAEPVAVTFSSGAPRGEKRKPEDESGDEPDAKKPKP